MRGQEIQKLSAKQQKALCELLANPTVSIAAAAAGVAESTLWRWLDEEQFKKAYRAARLSLVEKSISELQSACVEAVQALRRNLTCENPQAEIRAAQIILEQSVKAVELLDLEQRLSEIERLNK